MLLKSTPEVLIQEKLQNNIEFQAFLQNMQIIILLLNLRINQAKGQ